MERFRHARLRVEQVIERGGLRLEEAMDVLDIGIMGVALESINVGEKGDVYFPAIRSKVSCYAVKYVGKWADVMIVKIERALKRIWVRECSPVPITYIYGYPYIDVATDDSSVTPHPIEFTADKWTEYVIGTNMHLINPSLPEEFEAQLIRVNPTVDAYIKFESGVIDKLEADSWVEYNLRVKKLWVKGVSAPGVLRLRAFG